MSYSETRAAIVGALAASISLLLNGRTLVSSRGLPVWPLLLPLVPPALLILVAVTTPVARQKQTPFWTMAQSVIYFAALTIGVAAALAVSVGIWLLFTEVHGDAMAAGSVLVMFPIACTYTCVVLWIDQEKLGGRLFRAWIAFAIAGALSIIGPLVLSVLWSVLSSVL